ncbi:GPR endopeptidase [Saliterribacillus persicus]|uniref:Germination protease n=2 Tax=Saliterribacillus persicus TaxID=930114 RepID=A0A368XBH1_9BACI|nr:GPR endopeptidase [Saliterribacillus persicus]
MNENTKKDMNVRTDLATEAREMVNQSRTAEKEIEGVSYSEKKEESFTVSKVIVDEIGAEKIGKKPGTYRTIYSDAIKKQDTKLQQQTARVLAKELSQIMNECGIDSNASGLIVGLGNRNVTPDALGPIVMDKILVTNHLFVHEPSYVKDGYRRVSTIVPGVMGVTGIETSELIHGIIKEIKPDFVIAIDALASRSIERVNATIQLSDTGIHPGSGVGNTRKEISQETLGIPVIAIGVPTVVDAVTIASDAMDYVLKHIGRELEEIDRPSKALAPGGMVFGKKVLTKKDMPTKDRQETILGMFGTLKETEKRALMQEVLTPLGHNLMVTPKEIDGYIKDMAHLIAEATNASLHENVTLDNFGSYTR